MRIGRYLSLFDLVVVIVAAAAMLLPAASQNALEGVRGSDVERIALARAEANAWANPTSGAASAERSWLLARAGFNDFSIVTPAVHSERQKAAPDGWRAMWATASALMERSEAKLGLEWGIKAIAACEQAGPPGCPQWEAVKLDLFRQFIEAGLSAGMDPKTDPEGFYSAGERGLRPIRLGP